MRSFKQYLEMHGAGDVEMMRASEREARAERAQSAADRREKDQNRWEPDWDKKKPKLPKISPVGVDPDLVKLVNDLGRAVAAEKSYEIKKIAGEIEKMIPSGHAALERMLSDFRGSPSTMKKSDVQNLAMYIKNMGPKKQINESDSNETEIARIEMIIRGAQDALGVMDEQKYKSEKEIAQLKKSRQKVSPDQIKKIDEKITEAEDELERLNYDKNVEYLQGKIEKYKKELAIVKGK